MAKPPKVTNKDIVRSIVYLSRLSKRALVNEQHKTYAKIQVAVYALERTWVGEDAR